jgi:tRNA(Arg) A34 adenosine deaminase TadA
MAAFDDLRAERDALGFIGVLAHAFLTWDPPIAAGLDSHGNADFTHYAGLNIHALIVDNLDGEVLAIERNLIHEGEDPTRHAEQGAIRAALARLRVKRPRGAGVSVENYYRSHLFYDAGSANEDFVRKGCTLYTTLEPCPMCTTTICVCRMKRTVFIIQDKKFGGSWGDAKSPGIKDHFYPSYDLSYGPFGVVGSSPIATKAGAILDTISPLIQAMRTQGLQDTWFLDRLHDQLGAALDALTTLKDSDVAATGGDKAINLRTLMDLKRLCRLPG